jgi:hypothetical protein
MNSMNNRESYHHPITPSGPRPKVKATLLVDGIPVKFCESPMEMQVRLLRLRKRGDQRAPERIIQEDFCRRANKMFKKEHPHGD